MQRHQVQLYYVPQPGISATWGREIFVPFAPDEVIVRSVSLVIDNPAGVVPYHHYVLRCDTLGVPLAVVRYGDRTITPQTAFALGDKKINTTWHFSLTDVDYTPVDDQDGEIVFLLEFVKH